MPQEPVPFYMSPQSWEGEQQQGNPDRGQGQHPASFPDLPHPVPKAGSRTKEAQSWECPQPAFGQSAFLAPSSGVWQPHWVTQPPAGDNDHTVGSHAYASTKAQGLKNHWAIASTHSGTALSPSIQFTSRPCLPLPVTQGKESTLPVCFCPSPPAT